MECVAVRRSSVGGSYLTHITKTFQPFIGRDSRKISANRNKPLPLLVVHSGKTTTGRSDVLRISSNERGLAPAVVGEGTLPVSLRMVNNETSLKPVIGICEVGLRLEAGTSGILFLGARRPGVCKIGEEVVDGTD